MTRAGQEIVARLATVHRNGGTVVILLDYDGTLTPIVADPRLAVLDPARRELLAALAAIPRVAVGVISGRMLVQLQDFVGVPGLYYVGTGGMEIDLLGRRVHHPAERECGELIDTVARQLQSLQDQWVGSWIERKPVGITIHYRGVAADARPRFLAAVDTTLAPWMPQLSLLGGPMALEVLPRLGWNKGNAVEIILDHIDGALTMPIYVGDEANDGHAFAAVIAAGGLAVGVGAQAPGAASYWLADPDALRDLLGELRSALAADRSSSSSPSRR
ncbi:MAG TPA: trehalose-phosphatase [Gemmatimonadales bacterium]|jgi:trehalose-phosphatase